MISKKHFMSFQKFEKIICDTLQYAYINTIFLPNSFYFQENRIAKFLRIFSSFMTVGLGVFPL